MQHMWYFRKGKLEVSTPVVTGLRYYRDTTTGLHEVYFKQSPANLVGETWDTYVTYWMAVTMTDREYMTLHGDMTPSTAEIPICTTAPTAV